MVPNKRKFCVRQRFRQPAVASGEARRVRFFCASGFTLVELLTVIAIIGLLMSIVLPSMQRARDIGRNGLCLANLHAIGRTFEMYLSESNEILPNAASFPSEEPDKPCIADVFAPYIDENEVFHCPGDRDEPTFFETEGVSYEYLLGALYEVDDAPTLEKNFLIAMTSEKVSLSRVQVIYDFKENFHGWTNFLYADWHVSK